MALPEHGMDIACTMVCCVPLLFDHDNAALRWEVPSGVFGLRHLRFWQRGFVSGVTVSFCGGAACGLAVDALWGLVLPVECGF